MTGAGHLEIHMFEVKGTTTKIPATLYETFEEALAASPRDGERYLIYDVTPDGYLTPGGFRKEVKNGVVVGDQRTELLLLLGRWRADEPRTRCDRGRRAAEQADRKFWERWSVGSALNGHQEWLRDLHSAWMSLLWRGTAEPPPGENICPAMGY